MTEPAQTPFDSDLRPQWYIRQMAHGFGSLYRDRKKSGTWWVIECWIEKKRYRLLPVPGPLSAWVREFRPVGNLHDADAPAVPLLDNPRGLGKWPLARVV